ncbi:hypothetical protein PHLCEN_2v6751 [Hermanssonia centrifuga]|uniref:Uncharacterized protein n=1 Tax=Hermanssonia centrifuga TaxID=98765 RepID=A0A2R6NYH8_9APHY|nr:hypothetical protein PHLCEN_2v6751 [Hermanssonia centrifuga]
MRHLLLTAFNLVCTIYTAVNASPLPSARDDDCTVFVPSLGDNPIFISGESNTITCIHSVIITTLGTDIDPYAGNFTFTLPAVSADPYWIACKQLKNIFVARTMSIGS